MTLFKEDKMATAIPALEGATTVITINPRGVPDQETFRISKGRHQQVKWQTSDGAYFTVEFEGESPFYESQFSTDFPYSGSVRRNVLGDPKKIYNYTVRIGSNPPCDPGGIIDR
jgi:hypothetical protein